MSLVASETREQASGDVLVLRPAASAFGDPANLDASQTELLDAIAVAHCALVVIDFSEIRFCSSEVLGTLLRAQKLLRSGGRALRVAALGEAVGSIFKLCRLDQIIPVSKTVDAAIAAHAESEA